METAATSTQRRQKQRGLGLAPKASQMTLNLFVDTRNDTTGETGQGSPQSYGLSALREASSHHDEVI